MDDSGWAWITDFGLATISQNPDFKRAFLDDQSLWWTVLEILHSPGMYSKEPDIFLHVMVMIEVCYQ